MMKLEKDFEDFIALLNKHKVRYLIVGAYAVSYHSRPRNTGDIDFFVDNSEKNIRNVLKTLQDFGFKQLNLEYEDFKDDDAILQLGYEPVRIDIMTGITGVSFEDAYLNKEQASLGTQNTYFISLNDLIRNKEATGRLKDQSDAELLRKFKGC